MIDPKLETALNQQINKELNAWYAYLSMSAYCDGLHLNGFAAFFARQSGEEQDHAHRLIRYLLDRGGRLELRAIDAPRAKFASLVDLFTVSLEQERDNTRAIYLLYDAAREVSDYSTVAHLQWFLDEQVEEEKTMEDTLGLLRFAGDDKGALLALNNQIAARLPAAAGSAEGGAA